jgi:ABC-type antimicrobial peptide transport system permease subunit
LSGAMQPRQGHRNSLLRPAFTTLAFWQLRRTWFLLLFITLGMIAAIVIASAIPLLSNVMLTAGLRNTLRATPDSADIQLLTETNGISSPIVQKIHDQFDPLFHQYLGNVIKPDLSAILSEDFSLYPPQNHTSLTIYGTSMQQAAPHLDVIQGQLAHVTSIPSSVIEIMMTPDTAHLLGLHIGSTFKLEFQYFIYKTDNGVQQLTEMITARVAGLFNLTSAQAPYWHGEDFKPIKIALESSSALSQYTFLVSDNALLALIDHLVSVHHTDAIHTQNSNGYSLIWHYHLDSSQLDISGLDALIGQIAGIQSVIDSQYGYLETGGSDFTIEYPYLIHLELAGQALSFNGNPGILDAFQSRIAVARIPTGVFTLLILSFILFFISLLTTLLVDRQQDTIALLRSRGASRTQIFGAFFLQSVGLGMIALVIGLPLATIIVLLISQSVLSPAELDALNSITSHPFQVTLGSIWYALAITLIALFTMGISLFAAARMNVLSLRREVTRSNTRPLWQRLQLDVIAGIIALAAYSFSLYVTSIGPVLQGNAQVLIATPLSVIAPLFLIVGCLLLFLRLFPFFLRLGARIATRGRGAVVMLAFTQTARSPRQSLRMIMLFALATSFALFTLVFLTTQAEHIQEIVTYQTGADFSAQLLVPGTSVSQITNQYQSIPGVLSASVGFVGQGYGGTANLPLNLQAVDASSFGQTVIWPSKADNQSMHALLSQLVSLRKTSTTSDVVPAIVDQTFINRSLFHVGSFFSMSVSSVFPASLQCVIIGVVDHIPTNNTLINPVVTGGVLIDYQTYLNAYEQELKKNKNLSEQPIPPVMNQIWLHTKTDDASVASVRTALDNPKYSISHLVDRRLLLSTLQSDPLYLVLDGVLILGTATAFLVALVGGVLASWLSARSRQISYITLQALGATTRQTSNILMWEQAIVYITGLLLGAGFGTLLIVSVIPSLTFTDLNSNLSDEQFFALQSLLSTQIIVPPWIPLVLITLVGIYILALLIMLRVVSGSMISKKLRLAED